MQFFRIFIWAFLHANVFGVELFACVDVANKFKSGNGECRANSLTSTIRDILMEFNNSDVERIYRYLGSLPLTYEKAVSHGLNLESVWGSRKIWSPNDCGDNDDKEVSSSCGRMCNHRTETMPLDSSIEYMTPKPVDIRKALECDGAYEMSQTLCNALTVTPGYECLLDKPILTLTGPGCGDDVFGLHVPPTLTKNRPLIPDHLNNNQNTPDLQESGVLMPFHFKRHFIEATQALKQFKETEWENKKNGVIFRGALTSGPPPGIGAIQRCGSDATPPHLFRGNKNDFFIPGLPWRCRGASRDRRSDEDEKECQKWIKQLPKQASRLELIQKWGDKSIENGMIDVDIVLGSKHTISKANGVLRACGLEQNRSLIIKNQKMDIETQLKYKYMLSVEGADKATGLQWMLASGSVVIMPLPSQESWLLESRLIPWIYFVPIRSDFSDLGRIVRWLNDHPDKAKEIALNGQEYMKQFGNEDHELLISGAVLRLYSAYLYASAMLTSSQTHTSYFTTSSSSTTTTEKKKKEEEEEEGTMDGKCWDESHGYKKDHALLPPEHFMLTKRYGYTWTEHTVQLK
mmetsp:Transcript_2153/g.2674  ORF Transcript_2153/g.2674 Transcript_2153/m.2674 type:complete len:574 (+) Transcript_2153:85-1806(+)